MNARADGSLLDAFCPPAQFAGVKKRILLYASTGGSFGGVEEFVMTLARYLKGRGEFEVKLLLKVRRGCSLQQSLRDLIAEHGVELRLFRSNFAVFLSAVAWADVVHANFPAAYLGPVCRALGKPYVLTVHNWLREKTSWKARLEHRCLLGAKRRWYDSAFVAGNWQDPRGLPGGEVVPAVSDFPTTSVAPEARKGFVFAARWIENKGLEELIEAYATADLDREKHPLVLLGDGPRRARAEELLRQFGSAGITMPGFVTIQAKNGFISRARWLVAPAKTLEDLGLTPIEARSCGVPSIVTRDGGLPEAAGEAGMIVQPGNVAELREALQTAAAMPAETYAARARLAKDSLPTYLKPLSFYEEEYRQVLGLPAK